MAINPFQQLQTHMPGYGIIGNHKDNEIVQKTLNNLIKKCGGIKNKISGKNNSGKFELADGSLLEVDNFFYKEGARQHIKFRHFDNQGKPNIWLQSYETEFPAPDDDPCQMGVVSVTQAGQKKVRPYTTCPKTKEPIKKT